LHWNTTRKSVKTNRITDKIILSVIFTDGYNYVCNLVSLYRETFVVGNNYRWHRIADRIYRILKKRNNVMTWNFFRWFYRQNDRGIQTGIYVQWRVPFTVKITDGYTDRTCPSVIPSVKANIFALCRLSPLFLLLLSSQTANNHPPP